MPWSPIAPQANIDNIIQARSFCICRCTQEITFLIIPNDHDHLPEEEVEMPNFYYHMFILEEACLLKLVMISN